MSESRIDIDLGRQRLLLTDRVGRKFDYPVSTAARGPGERNGSLQTPRGRHRVRAMIGHGAPPGTVFVGRRPTGEVYSDALAAAYPDRDWILTRILWLHGLEPGRNRRGDCDTMRRYIYIHGAPDTVAMGQSGSHGCVRMSNVDVIDLFGRISPGIEVLLHE